MTIKKHLEENELALRAFHADSDLHEKIEETIQTMMTSLKSGAKVLCAGNGGSAADAQHFAAELVSRFYKNRPALAAIALTTDTSILTAISNDFGYEEVFSRQIEGIGNKGDVFLAISTSGNSKNILKAIAVAKEKGLCVVSLTGASGGQMKELSDHCLMMPSESTPRIQECHLLVEHIICAEIEERFFPKQ